MENLWKFGKSFFFQLSHGHLNTSEHHPRLPLKSWVEAHDRCIHMNSTCCTLVATWTTMTTSQQLFPSSMRRENFPPWKFNFHPASYNTPIYDKWQCAQFAYTPALSDVCRSRGKSCEAAAENCRCHYTVESLFESAWKSEILNSCSYIYMCVPLLVIVFSRLLMTCCWAAAWENFFFCSNSTPSNPCSHHLVSHRRQLTLSSSFQHRQSLQSSSDDTVYDHSVVKKEWNNSRTLINSHEIMNSCCREWLHVSIPCST